MSSENKFYQKWWFWAIIGVVILGIIINFSSNPSDSSTDLTGQVTNNNNLEDNSADNLVQEETEVKNCLPNWQCSSWSTCSSGGQQTRICTDSNNCGIADGKLPETQKCTPPTWHEVTVFSGTEDKTTDIFNR